MDFELTKKKQFGKQTEEKYPQIENEKQKNSMK